MRRCQTNSPLVGQAPTGENVTVQEKLTDLTRQVNTRTQCWYGSVRRLLGQGFWIEEKMWKIVVIITFSTSKEM